jgi:hypothetical protein
MPCTEKATSVFKKFKKVACHQFVTPPGQGAAAAPCRKKILGGNKHVVVHVVVGQTTSAITADFGSMEFFLL